MTDERIELIEAKLATLAGAVLVLAACAMRGFTRHNAPDVAALGLRMLGSSIQPQEAQETAPILDALVDRVTKEFK